MMNQRLDFLLRKNKGKKKIGLYRKMFIDAGFKENDLKYIELQESDNFLAKIRTVFPSIDEQTEVLIGSHISDSSLLNDILKENEGQSPCYIFSDDVDICGMFFVKSCVARKYCLNVAKLGYSQTCFIVAVNLNFSATINYDGSLERDIFDVHVKRRSSS